MSQARSPRSMKRKAAIAALCVGLTAGGYAVASAATGSSASGTTSTAPAGPNAPYGGPDHGRFGPRGTPPAALTGDTLAKATAAAKAKVPGATVDAAFAADRGKGSYVVLMTKADTSHVAVVLDSSFAVVAVRTRPEGPAGERRGMRGPGHRPGETALTGDTLAKATAAAKAKVPGATVDAAFAADRGKGSYVVLMTKADTSHVAVVLDSSFAVVAVRTRPEGPAGERRGMRGPGHRPGETALTGDTLAKVAAAAKAKVPGATLDRAETDADGHAKYEAHMTKADGTHVTVYVNADFTAVSVKTAPARRPHGPQGRPRPWGG